MQVNVPLLNRLNGDQSANKIIRSVSSFGDLSLIPPEEKLYVGLPVVSTLYFEGEHFQFPFILIPQTIKTVYCGLPAVLAWAFI